MPKISDLEPITSIAEADELAIRDVSANTTKRISLLQLKDWLVSLVGWVTTAMITDKAITAAKIEDQQAWQTPTYLNGWIAFDAGTEWGGAQYYKDSLGIVHFRGLLKSGTTADTTTLFTMPAGYRPSRKMLLNIASNNAFCRVDVHVDGSVKISGANFSSSWVAFGMLTYRAEA